MSSPHIKPAFDPPLESEKSLIVQALQKNPPLHQAALAAKLDFPRSWIGQFVRRERRMPLHAWMTVWGLAKSQNYAEGAIQWARLYEPIDEPLDRDQERSSEQHASIDSANALINLALERTPGMYPLMLSVKLGMNRQSLGQYRRGERKMPLKAWMTVWNYVGVGSARAGILQWIKLYEHIDVRADGWTASIPKIDRLKDGRTKEARELRQKAIKDQPHLQAASEQAGSPSTTRALEEGPAIKEDYCPSRPEAVISDGK